MRRFKLFAIIFVMLSVILLTSKTVFCSVTYSNNITFTIIENNKNQFNYLPEQDRFSKNSVEILKMLKYFDVNLQKRKSTVIAWEWKNRNGTWKKEGWKWGKQQKKSNNKSDTELSEESLNKMEESYRERAEFFKKLEAQLNELKNSLLGTDEKSKISK